MSWEDRYASENSFNLDEWNNRFDQSNHKAPNYLRDLVRREIKPTTRWMSVGKAYNGEWTPPGATSKTMTYEHPYLSENDQFIHVHENGRWRHGDWKHPEMHVNGQSDSQEQGMQHALKSFKDLNLHFNE